jgi:NitT/TauT family transport system substrate-binding protein
MVTRRQFLKATSALGAGLAVSGPVLGRGQKLEPFHMACWSNKISEQANIYAAEEFGWFKAEGIDFEFKPGQGGGDALKHVLAGNADIAMANVEAMLFAMEQGAKLVSVYDVYPQNVFNVVSLKKSNVGRPADLRGKPVGVYSMASGTRYNLQVILAKNGMSEKDVETVAVGIFNFGPLSEGKVLATCATDTGLWDAQRKGLGEVSVIWAREYLNTPTDVFVVTEETLQKRTSTVRGFLKAYKKGMQYAIDKPVEAARLAEKYAIDGKDQERALAHLRLRIASSISEGTKKHGLGWHDLPVLQDVVTTFQGLGLIKQPVDVNKTFTNRFIAEI